jgi:hypothetical protein
MSQESSPPSTPTRPAPSAEKQALLEAFDTVLKTQAEEREASLREAEAHRRAKARARPLITAATVIVLGVGAYLVVVRPSWVFAPRAVPESLALKDASLRVAMASAIQHVERFQHREAHLPTSLAEAGARSTGLRFERVGDAGFRLIGENGPAHAVYNSGEELADFLGNSYQIIVRRSR